MTRLLLIRANEPRHRALSARLIEGGFELNEIVEVKTGSSSSLSTLQIKHFKARQQFENDYFRYLHYDDSDRATKVLHTPNVNDEQSIVFAERCSADYIITFGSSILKKEWIDKFRNRILGIHLGLSPYYRGSGTNFFPFVNQELGAIGFTLMNLDEGVDTGAIIHQAYANFVQGDSIHSVGNRLLQEMYDAIVRLMQIKVDLSQSVKQPQKESGRLYRKKDFTDLALTTALTNIQNGIIDKFIDDELNQRMLFPLIKEI
jgi:methionyl-tRNA formyltransferase